MADLNEDARSPWASSRRKFGWRGCVVVGLAIAAALFNWPKDEVSTLHRAQSEGIPIIAMANRFFLIDHSWRRFEDKHAFNAELTLFKSPLGRTIDLTPQLIRTLCGQLLTEMSKLPEAPVERRDLFRVTLAFPIFEKDEPTGELYGKGLQYIPIEDGTCPTNLELEEATVISLFPGALRDWGLKSIHEYRSNLPNAPESAAVFVSRTGRLVPPLPFTEGCQAAVFEFGDVIEDIADDPTRMTVLFLGTMFKDLWSSDFEPAAAQDFTISDGICSASSEIYQMQWEE